MNKISVALVKAQKQFAPALKTNTNPHFKSKCFKPFIHIF
jgi:hypothetical protein